MPRATKTTIKIKNTGIENITQRHLNFLGCLQYSGINVPPYATTIKNGTQNKYGHISINPAKNRGTTHFIPTLSRNLHPKIFDISKS